MDVIRLFTLGLVIVRLGCVRIIIGIDQQIYEFELECLGYELP